MTRQVEAGGADADPAMNETGRDPMPQRLRRRSRSDGGQIFAGNERFMTDALVIGVDSSTTACKAIAWNRGGTAVAEQRLQRPL
jgi:hypothetical protein